MIWLMVLLLTPPPPRAVLCLPWVTLGRRSLEAALHRLQNKQRWVEGEVVIGFAPASASAVQQAVEARGYRVKLIDHALRFMLLEVPRCKTTLQAVRELRKLPGVTYAEPNDILQLVPGKPGPSVP